jgi:hypothetical protein
MPPPAALVCQYLENVSSEMLEKYQAVVREYASGSHGVYALYDGDRLYYVGLASDLPKRLSHHLKDRHAGLWDHFSLYVTETDRHIRELEALLIRIAKPKGNAQRGRIRNAENLRPMLKRDLRRRHEQEIVNMLGGGKVRRVRLTTTSNRPRRSQYAVALEQGLDKAYTLRAKYKGQSYRGRIRRNGTVRINGKVYDNPSDAASAVAGRRVNGFYFWRYEQTDGEWAALRHLFS